MAMAIDARSGQADIWGLIQEAKKKEAELQPPYVHPLLKRSSSFLSQKSLEICTESLGSETGSDGFSDLDDPLRSSPDSDDLDYLSYEDMNMNMADRNVEGKGQSLSVVNYHFSASRRSPPRSFPPPLPSISRRDGPCFNMRTHRQNGRLVMQAVPVPSQNYLHCKRQDGRLLLSFIATAFEEIYPEIDQESLKVQTKELVDEVVEEEYGEAMEVEEVQEEVEEEVEVVDRGIVVEVKVSRQPQAPSGGGVKVHRSALVFNKFVSGAPTPTAEKVGEEEEREEMVGKRRAELERKKLFISSKGTVKRQELLYQVRRCSETRSPLFIWEPFCIATT